MFLSQGSKCNESMNECIYVLICRNSIADQDDVS